MTVKTLGRVGMGFNETKKNKKSKEKGLRRLKKVAPFHQSMSEKFTAGRRVRKQNRMERFQNNKKGLLGAIVSPNGGRRNAKILDGTRVRGEAEESYQGKKT